VEIFQRFPIGRNSSEKGNHPSKQQGPITYNFETPLLTDGDASYKAYFEVITVRQTL